MQVLKPAKMRAVTLYDVARHAGTSQNVASVVLNGAKSTGRVSDETRRRLETAAAELGYHPNLMARGLTRVRLNSLGVSFTTMHPEHVISDYYNFAVLKGILSVTLAAGYNVTHFHKPWRDARRSAAAFRNQGVDGFLIVAPDPDSDIAAGLSAIGVPLVVVSSTFDEQHAPSVDVDNARGVHLAMEHLFALGHRRIAHLTFNNERYDMRARQQTYLTCLEDAGISVPAEYLQRCGALDMDRVFYDSTRRLLSLPEPPTAIFAASDWVAFQALDAARDMGVRVPDQLSIVGFDDSPDSALTSPSLTTLRQPLIAMGQAATRTLIALVEGEAVANETRWFEPELIVRGSTGPASR